MKVPKLKARKASSHKGQNGIVLVIGGSEEYVGAPAFVGMSALAAMRAGADLCYVAAPEKTAWAISCISPDLITRKLPGKYLQEKHLASIKDLVKKSDACAIGNGLGLRKQTKKFVKKFVKHAKTPLVIDADALKVIRIQDAKNSVLTPHTGEFRTLLKNSGLNEKNFRKHLGNNVLVLKGHPKTKIITKNKTALNKTGNAGMTHGGTGDVLAGIITGLIAQGNDAFTSARIACYASGKAADALYRKKGLGYLASDLVKKIPEFLKKFQKIK